MTMAEIATATQRVLEKVAKAAELNSTAWDATPGIASVTLIVYLDKADAKWDDVIVRTEARRHLTRGANKA